MSPAEAPGSTTPGRNVFGRFFHWVANATPQFFRQRLDQSSPVSEKRKHEDAFQHASFADEPAHAAGGASQPVATDSQRQEQQREDGQQLKRPRMEQSNLTELFREFKVSNTSQDANAQPCADEHRTPELAWGHLQPRNQDDSAVKPQALNFAFDTPALPASARPEQQQQQKGWHRPAPAQYFRPQLEALQRSRTPYASRHLAVPFGTPMLASAQPSPRGGMAAEASLAGTSQRSIDVLRNRNQGFGARHIRDPGLREYSKLLQDAGGLRTRPLQRDYRPQGLMELLLQTSDVDDLMARAEEAGKRRQALGIQGQANTREIVAQFASQLSRPTSLPADQQGNLQAALQQGKAYQQEAESVKFDLQDRRNAVRAQAQREKERAEQGPQKLQQQRAAAAAVAAAAARRPAGRAAEPKPKAKPVEDDDVVEILDSDDEASAVDTVQQEQQRLKHLHVEEEYEEEEHEEEEEEEEYEEEEEEREEGAAFEVTDEEQATWDLVFKKGANKAELLINYKNYEISRDKLHCMAPGTWLNDEAINMYMVLLQERDTALRSRPAANAPRCHFFNSFFLAKLYRDTTKYNYKAVQRWTTLKRLQAAGQASPNLLDVDRIIIPVNCRNVHWTCCVIDVQNEEFVYYDSMGGIDAQLLDHLAQYMQDEARDKCGGRMLDTSTWQRKFNPGTVPRQRNGCDCGVFSIMFADRLGLGKPFDFTQGDMNGIRVKVLHRLVSHKI